MTDLLSLSITECKELLASMGEKPFRAKQIFSWLHGKRATCFDEMTDLSKALREKLQSTCTITRLTVERRQVSAEDGTQKMLFCLPDGNLIESVFMKYHHGNTICVST